MVQCLSQGAFSAFYWAILTWDISAMSLIWFSVCQLPLFWKRLMAPCVFTFSQKINRKKAHRKLLAKYRGHKNSRDKKDYAYPDETTELLFCVPKAKYKVSQDPCQACSISSLETTRSFRHCTGGAGGTRSCHGESRKGPSALLGGNGRIGWARERGRLSRKESMSAWGTPPRGQQLTAAPGPGRSRGFAAEPPLPSLPLPPTKRRGEPCPSAPGTAAAPVGVSPAAHIQLAAGYPGP